MFDKEIETYFYSGIDYNTIDKLNFKNVNVPFKLSILGILKLYTQ